MAQVFICYHGIFAVHSAPPDELLGLRKRRDRVLAIPVANSEEQYTRVSEKRLGTRVATLKRGNSFGERGLAPTHSEVRNATVAAFTDDCHLFCIHRQDLMGLSQEQKKRRPTAFGDKGPDEILLEILAKPANLRTPGDIELIATKCGWHAFFEGADPEATRVVFRQLKLVRAPPGRVIVLQGDLADCFYLVYWGSCAVWATPKTKALNQWKGLNLWIPEDDSNDSGEPRVCKLPVSLAGKQVAKLDAGQSFGESGLDPAGSKRRTASIISTGARVPRPDGSPIRLDDSRDGETLLLVVYRDDIDCRAAEQPTVAETARRASVTEELQDGGVRLSQAQLDEAADELAIAETEQAHSKTEGLSTTADEVSVEKRRRSSLAALKTEEMEERARASAHLRSRLSRVTGTDAKLQKSLRNRMSNAGAQDQLKGIEALAAAHEEHATDGDGALLEESEDESSGDESSGDDLEDSKDLLGESQEDLDPLSTHDKGDSVEHPAQDDDDDPNADPNAPHSGGDGGPLSTEDEDLERDWNKWRRVAYVVELENYEKLAKGGRLSTAGRETKAKRGSNKRTKIRKGGKDKGSGDKELDEKIAMRRRNESISDGPTDGPNDHDTDPQDAQDDRDPSTPTTPKAPATPKRKDSKPAKDADGGERPPEPADPA